MKMFLGQYQPNITEGSRVALPKKLRDQITGDEIILSRGFEPCIFVYDRNDWEKETLKQIENPITEAKTRDLKRYMFAAAVDVEIDAQGRFVIPASLKDYAQLKTEVTVIGAGDHVEIWDKSIWDSYLTNISADFAEKA